MRYWLALFLLCLSATVAAAADTALSFQHGGYWLTNPTAADLTLQAAIGDTQQDRAQVKLYRLDAPELLAQVVTARALRSIGEAELLRRVVATAPVWQGALVLPPADPKTGLAQQGVPALTMAGSLPGGVYVITADVGAGAGGMPRAVQWFIVSDFALKARFAGDRVFVAAIDTARRRGVAGVTLRWCDAQGKIIGEQALPAQGDSLGMQVLARPKDAALLLAVQPGATSGDGGGIDYTAVPDAQQAVKLDGALVYPSAPVYDALQPFTFLIARPGEAPPAVMLNDKVQTVTQAIRGVWSLTVPPRTSDGPLHLQVGATDGSADMFADVTVPAAVRATLAVSWQARPEALFSGQGTILKFQLKSGGKTLGATTGQLTLLPFGVTVATPTPPPALQLPFTTDADGSASVTIPGDALPPGAANYHLQLTAAQQQLAMPPVLATYPGQSWLEIKPLFADLAVPENVTAQFLVTGHSAKSDGKGSSTALPVHYKLDRETYSFEWYQADDGRWTYRTKTVLAPVLSGDAKPDRKGTPIAVPVTAGRYRLTVADAAGGLTATQSFTAGWWLAQPTPATPEKIELTAQVDPKTDQQPERIAVFVDPPFAARVWLTVMNRGGSAQPQLLDVPDEGGFAYFDRTSLPPGQPLLLTAYAVPRDPAAGLVQAEGLETLPLGGKVALVLADRNASGKEKPPEPILQASGLPVDQPVDRNIVQALAVIYDATTNEQLGAPQPVTVDTAGKATIALPHMKAEPKQARLPQTLVVRLLVAHQDRLDITEQSVVVPPPAAVKVTGGKSAAGKQRAGR